MRKQGQWSFLRNNQRVLGVLKYKFEASGKSYADIARLTGATDSQVRAYFEGNYPSLLDYDIIRIADEFGVRLSIDITLSP